jgi:hypothetical protein
MKSESGDRTAPRTFRAWTQRWSDLATYTGTTLADSEDRARAIIDLWNCPIPGTWKRPCDEQLMHERYRRGDQDCPHRGEHTIEHKILCEFFADLSVFDAELIDGINAMPLAADKGGERANNVETDLYLLVRKSMEYRLIVAEVKDHANHAWYATVENLRQLKLVCESETARELFRRRAPARDLPREMPITGIVLAPARFYSANGQKAQSTQYAKALTKTMRRRVGCDVRLAVWDPLAKRVDELGESADRR